jgi:hypothetical protein
MVPEMNADAAAELHAALSEREKFGRAMVDREKFRRDKARAGGS